MKHKTRIYTTCLVAVVAALALAIGGEANLLNPGFEDPLGPEWTLEYVWGGPSEFWITDRTTVSHHNGQWGLHFKNNHDGTMHAYFKQVVAGLVPGASYSVGAWMRRTWKRTDKYDVYLQVLGGGLSQRSPTAPEDCSWAWYDVIQTADSNGQIEVRLHYDKFGDTVDYKWGDGYFDSLSMELVPEPGTFAALVAGLLGLGFVVRRR